MTSTLLFQQISRLYSYFPNWSQNVRSSFVENNIQFRTKIALHLFIFLNYNLFYPNAVALPCEIGGCKHPGEFPNFWICLCRSLAVLVSLFLDNRNNVLRLDGLKLHLIRSTVDMGKLPRDQCDDGLLSHCTVKGSPHTWVCIHVVLLWCYRNALIKKDSETATPSTFPQLYANMWPKCSALHIC